jgi:hypothetical protein
MFFKYLLGWKLVKITENGDHDIDSTYLGVFLMLLT